MYLYIHKYKTLQKCWIFEKKLLLLAFSTFIRKNDWVFLR